MSKNYRDSDFEINFVKNRKKARFYDAEDNFDANRKARVKQKNAQRRQRQEDLYDEYA